MRTKHIHVAIFVGEFALAMALTVTEVVLWRDRDSPRGAAVTRVAPAPGTTATVWTVPGLAPRATTVVVWLAEPEAP